MRFCLCGWNRFVFRISHLQVVITLWILFLWSESIWKSHFVFRDYIVDECRPFDLGFAFYILVFTFQMNVDRSIYVDQ